ncbi:dTDP-4-dehydrorhamnose 3,5-epimerase [Ensifer sp. ENS09]|uniref:dTDP-4-dehydrorhamnose 3,5-epimerase n=1 Tax=Ensifer sp. ENS09 TaxID=2769263 RepID=UPI00177D9E4A|nr:dTDP-4-dehydrorhamnose 3,5-epimerase [Ensifer sp. ENS09]MBD9653010.1 dTDP-4-dehydrorhamnose 3,5-epimerase [Ensifer sp. ENS09]
MSSKLTLIKPRRYSDERGWFVETYSEAKFTSVGIAEKFVQDNHSLSKQPFVVRGLHFQAPPFEQGKLVRCVKGRILDVAVDIRRGSPTWGKWISVELSSENGWQLFVPAGFAHGFMTLEPLCEVVYKVSNPYSKENEGGVKWNDVAIGIDWPVQNSEHAILSKKDEELPTLAGLDSPFQYDGAPMELRELEV